MELGIALFNSWGAVHINLFQLKQFERDVIMSAFYDAFFHIGIYLPMQIVLKQFFFIF